MNKILGLTAVLFFCVPVLEAGLITRTYTYTSGNTISANENNTNENTLYNEINGNITTANITDGTIQNGDIADTQIAVGKFASVVQATFTYVNTFGTYRRPVLMFISVTTVDISTNTGTSNQTCVQFPDERRCVTEDVTSTSVNRRFIITETASFSGTKNSGLAPGETEGNNKFYCLYAVKVTDNGTDFVVAGSTNSPIISEFARLNTLFGTNGWVYLGLIHNGDGNNNAADILRFKQVGGTTILSNSEPGQNTTVPGTGYLLTNVTNGAVVTSSPTFSTAAGGTAPTIGHVYWSISGSGLSTLSYHIGNRTGTVLYQTPHSNAAITASTWIPAEEGVNVKASDGSGSRNIDARIAGWIDAVLTPGYNAQL